MAPHIETARSLFPQQRTFSSTAISVAKGQKLRNPLPRFRRKHSLIEKRRGLTKRCRADPQEVLETIDGLAEKARLSETAIRVIGSVILSSQQWLASQMKLAIFLGSISAAIGVLAILLSLGLFGPAPSSNHGENSWLGVAFGIAFLFAGISVSSFKPCSPAAIRLPRNCQLQRGPWLRSLHCLLGLGVIVSLGAMFTWVAVASGKRSFTGSGAIFGETGGRIAFGIGSILIWIFLAAILFSKARRLIRRHDEN